MLPDVRAERIDWGLDPICLNAPDGAGCSLTFKDALERAHSQFRLNAPDGAGCSLTLKAKRARGGQGRVS